MKLKPWDVRVRSTTGYITIRVYTATQRAAIESTMSHEGCKRDAILWVRPGKD